MRRLLPILCCGLLTFFSATAQRTYEIRQDPGDQNSRIYVGIIQKEDLESDTSFHWYSESQQMYPHPDKALVNAFVRNRDSIYFIIFTGTWCEDSRYIIPKFFRVQEASKFPEDHITVFAVDRSKRTWGHLARAMDITATPTIIVMKDGKEMGRMVEYGKTGLWDQGLAAIIDGAGD